jgi:hypothetical protein
MTSAPLSASPLLLAGIILLWPWWGQSQNPGAGAAVSSEAAATQPKIPEQLPVPTPTEKTLKPTPAPSGAEAGAIDPLLDPSRPRNSQLTMAKEQTVSCGEVEVILPEGVYKQILVVENPEGRRATDTTELRRQQVGWGYIRYLSDAEIMVGGQKRSGGLDVGIRAEDKLPVRIWYKKMTQPDDITKAFTFILPPVGLVSGAGAWSSGNTLLPDAPPTFTEARDYFLKQPPPEEPTAQPAFRGRPAEPQPSPGLRTNR